MLKELIIQDNEDETWAALMEENRLVEVYYDKAIRNRLLGNIYKGKVANVLPGMQAAFIDIGLKKNAFLYVEDAIPNKYIQDMEEKEEKTQIIPKINDILKEGQSIIVQIIKEPHGTKGARVTANITLPGRYLVLMPTVNYNGVSRRIEEEAERNRLKNIARNISCDDMGIIVRTVAKDATQDELEKDFNLLKAEWKKIEEKQFKLQAPSIIHQDINLIDRILRDILTKDINRIIVNSNEAYEKTFDFTSVFAPDLKYKIDLKEKNNIFDEYGIINQIENALKRKVWFDCGGYLIIDQVEALTIIDVNTGKYVGKNSLSETVLKTNLQAATEIARQLRIRNIGGIIIVDFIDMLESTHQALVLEALEEELKKDKTKTHILGLTQLGLVELTRKKTRCNLSNLFQKDCPYCKGKGKILNEDVIINKIKRKINDNIANTINNVFLIESNINIVKYLLKNYFVLIKHYEARYGKKIFVRGRIDIHQEQYRITSLTETSNLTDYIWPLHEGDILPVYINKISPHKETDGLGRIGEYNFFVSQAADLVGNTLYVEINNIDKNNVTAKIYSI